MNLISDYNTELKLLEKMRDTSIITEQEFYWRLDYLKTTHNCRYSTSLKHEWVPHEFLMPMPEPVPMASHIPKEPIYSPVRYARLHICKCCKSQAWQEVIPE